MQFTKRSASFFAVAFLSLLSASATLTVSAATPSAPAPLSAMGVLKRWEM